MKLLNILVFLHTFVGIDGFPIRKEHSKICKNIRVRSRLFLRNSYQDITSENSEILNNFKTIIKDDISNDILYYLKFYHLTNDNINAYIYIVFYETLSLILTNQKRAVYLPIFINNIIIYMSFKILLLQKILNHIN
jgi:hypothetical protein